MQVIKSLGAPETEKAIESLPQIFFFFFKLPERTQGTVFIKCT